MSLLSGLIPQAYAACTPGQNGINLGDCLTLGVGGDKVSTTYDTPASLINVIVPNLFYAAGIIFFIMVIYAGFQFINGGSKGKDQAQQIMTTALVGFIIMFVAYWVVQLLQVITGQQILF